MSVRKNLYSIRTCELVEKSTKAFLSKCFQIQELLMPDISLTGKPRENTNIARHPRGKDSKRKWPRCRCMMACTIAKPRPAPAVFLPALPRRKRKPARSMSDCEIDRTSTRLHYSH